MRFRRFGIFQREVCGFSDLVQGFVELCFGFVEGGRVEVLHVGLLEMVKFCSEFAHPFAKNVGGFGHAFWPNNEKHSQEDDDEF
jgi:hypothetical protein